MLPQNPKFADTPRRSFYHLAVRRVSIKADADAPPYLPPHGAATMASCRRCSAAPAPDGGFHLQSCRRFRQLQQPRIIILGQLDPFCQGLPPAAPVHLPHIAYVGLYQPVNRLLRLQPRIARSSSRCFRASSRLCTQVSDFLPEFLRNLPVLSDLVFQHIRCSAVLPLDTAFKSVRPGRFRIVRKSCLPAGCRTDKPRPAVLFQHWPAGFICRQGPSATFTMALPPA